MCSIKELLNIEMNSQRISEIRNNKKNIVPFIGAGASRSCGLLDWKELLDKLAKQYMSSKDREKYSTEDVDLIQYAEDISSATKNKVSFHRKVAELCNYDKCKLSILPKLIVKTYSGQIVTTNYDTILEYSARTNKRQMMSILPSSETKIIDAITHGKKFIYHIHGSVEEPTSIILTKSSYKQLYGLDGEKPSPVYETLSSLYANRMFLFIGCKLKKDYVLDILKTSNDRIPSSRHYAILELPETEEERIQFNCDLDEYGIAPIYYPKGKYECVGTILEYIAEGSKKTSITKKSTKKDDSTVETKSTIVDSIFDDYMYEMEKKYIDETVIKSIDNEPYLSDLEKAMNLLLKENDCNGIIKSIKFKDTMEKLLNSKEKYALAISGLQGTGKSTFLSLLFYRLYQLRDQNNIYPIIIDLHYWAKQDSNVDILTGLSEDLNGINKFIKRNSYSKYIFFIDGADESVSRTSELESQISLFIKQLDKGQFAFCISQAEKIPQSMKIGQHDINGYLNEAEHSIELHSLIKDGVTEIDKMVGYLAPIYGIKDENLTLLKKIVADNTTDRIDFRTILIILKSFIINPKSDLSLGECFLTHYKSMLVKNQTLLDVARSIYEYGVEEKSGQFSSSIHPEIFQKNAITRDFFLAIFFINMILNNYPKAVRRDFINKGIVFTAQVNRFIKDLMNTEYKNKTNGLIYEMITNWDKASVYMKSQFAYVLGRIEVSNDTLSFLKVEWKKLKDELFTGVVSKELEDETQTHKLFLFRTISVSLFKYDEAVSERKFFLSCVLKDERLSQINRGFHLAYYGDKAYVNGINLSYIDTLDSGIEKTMQHLYGNIKRALDDNTDKYKFFELDVITLFSLYQYRYENTDVQKRYKIHLRELIDELLRSNKVLENETLLAYLLMMKHCFDKYGNSAYASILREFYQVKNKKRTGWVERDVELAESVADHTYSSYLLALLTLPDSVETCVDYSIVDLGNYKGYSKQIIQKMLLIHDVAEAITGDIPTPRKTQEDADKEKEIIYFLSFLDSFPQIYGLEGMRVLWDEFDKNQTINANIANEIDKIDALVQAFIYSENNNGKISREEWIQYTDGEVNSSLGKEILKRILLAFGENSN